MKKRRINTIFANPYILNGVVWLFVLLVYQLGWSGLCPPLSSDMQIFMSVTVAGSLVAGIFLYYRGAISFTPLKSISMKSVWRLLIFIYVLFLIEIAASGGIPLMGYAQGDLTVSYKEFGLPIVHVIVVNGLSCIAIYCFYARASFKRIEGGSEEERKARKRLMRRLVLIIILCLIPFVLVFNRGAIMSVVLGMFLIILLSCRRPGLVVAEIMMAFMAIFFVFGWLGNMRSGKKFNDLILKVGKASVAFQASSIPDEFFWAYIYVATPLANAQNTVDRAGERIADTEELQDMILFEFTPELIAKRIKDEDDRSFKRHRSILLTENLNATSVYGRPYKYLGWPGMWLMYAFILFFIFVNLRIVPRESKWFVPTLTVLNVIIVMNLFDNMFIFTGMIPQLFIFIATYFLTSRARRLKPLRWRR